MAAATTSTIPACLDALTALVRRVLPAAQVFDGPPTDEMQGDLVMVGFAFPPGPSAVTDARTRQQYATSPDTESYDVANLVCAWPGGDTDLKIARDRAFAMVDAIGAGLADDPLLGGLVKRARISVDSYVPEQTDSGASVTVPVTIHIDANTR
jgi:hypothetical protein